MKIIDADTLIRQRTEHELDGGVEGDEMMRDGMSTEAAAVSDSETEASQDGDGFVAIAAGAATGLGVDRGAALGTGGLAAGEDLGAAAEGDYWRQNFRRRPYYETGRSYQYYEPGYRLGWESAAALEYQDRNFEDIEAELGRRWEQRRPRNAPGWVDLREPARDAWNRVRGAAG